VRAATYTGAGGAEVIAVRDDVPEPLVGSDDVLVAVAYAGLNRADILERQGRYPVAPAPIAIPGMEFSGVVRALGSHVTTLAVGDRVCGLVGAGAQAELLAVNALAVSRVPEGVSLRDAAAIPEAFTTAHDGLFTCGRFALGERALVHTVGSSVGLAAVALAKRAGGFVYATSRTASKLAAAREHGVDQGFVLEDGWVPKVRAASGGGVDVILDFVGTGMFDANISALAMRGRIVQIGTMGGAQASFNVGPMMAKRATLVSTVLRSRPIYEKMALAKHFERDLLPLFASGELRATIDCEFPLTALASAHEHMEGNANFGKIVLAVAPALDAPQK
jgi:NADPH:quinone reductase-like Zn-dependent oxidoreductase